MSESALTSAMLDYLKLTPDILALRLNAGQVMPGVKMQEKGCPDWLLICGPLSHFIELKRHDKGLNENQRAWFARAEKLGIQATVCWSVGNVRAVVERLRRERGER